MHPISTANAEHYPWGETCDGWFLVKSAELSIIQERVPPGTHQLRNQSSRDLVFIVTSRPNSHGDRVTVE